MVIYSRRPQPPKDVDSLSIDAPADTVLSEHIYTLQATVENFKVEPTSISEVCKAVYPMDESKDSGDRTHLRNDKTVSYVIENKVKSQGEVSWRK